LVVSVALPAVLVPKKSVSPLLVVMVALPAVLVSRKLINRLVVIVASPAVLEFMNANALLLVMMAFPAVLVLRNATDALFAPAVGGDGGSVRGIVDDAGTGNNELLACNIKGISRRSGVEQDFADRGNDVNTIRNT
jgi:hypothetical protein